MDCDPKMKPIIRYPIFVVMLCIFVEQKSKKSSDIPIHLQTKIHLFSAKKLKKDWALAAFDASSCKQQATRLIGRWKYGWSPTSTDSIRVFGLCRLSMQILWSECIPPAEGFKSLKHSSLTCKLQEIYIVNQSATKQLITTHHSHMLKLDLHTNVFFRANLYKFEHRKLQTNKHTQTVGGGGSPATMFIPFSIWPFGHWELPRRIL